MGKIQNTHDPKDQGQACGQQVKRQAKLQAVDALLDQQFDRHTLHLALLGVRIALVGQHLHACFE